MEAHGHSDVATVTTPQPSRDAAFDALFRAHYADLFRRVLFVVGDPAAADDVVQDTFAKAWLRWDRVVALDRPAGWLHTTALRAAVRHRGQRGRWASLLDAATALDEPFEGFSAALLEGLRRLSPKQRAAIVLSVLDDMPNAEIALTLGCNESTVRVHLHRARHNLARLDLKGQS